MIQLNNVSKKFLARKALTKCSANFESGKIIGIVGENGSGKTTMLKLLAGLLQPSRGEITIDSTLVTRRVSKKLAYLTDMDYFYPYFTIQQLVSFYESQFPDFDKDKADEMIDFMKLDHKQKIKHLSKGNKNRLKIAVTLSRNAPYVVLDEPFSGLDPIVRKAIIHSIIKFVNLERQTLIITTHEIKEIEPILDEVVLLKNGMIIAHKSVDLIREEYKMNIVDWMEEIYSTTGVRV